MRRSILNLPFVVLLSLCCGCGAQRTDISTPATPITGSSSNTTKACPNCHANIPMQAKYCLECGAKQ